MSAPLRKRARHEAPPHRDRERDSTEADQLKPMLCSVQWSEPSRSQSIEYSQAGSNSLVIWQRPWDAIGLDAADSPLGEFGVNGGFEEFSGDQDIPTQLPSYSQQPFIGLGTQSINIPLDHQPIDQGYH